MSTPEQIECQILEAHEALESEWRSSDPTDAEATRALKDAIGTAGE